jgi:hypothetical protein
MKARPPANPPDGFRNGFPQRRERVDLWLQLDKCGYTKKSERHLGRLNFVFDRSKLSATAGEDQSAAFERHNQELAPKDKSLLKIVSVVQQFVRVNYLQESAAWIHRGKEHPGHTALKSELEKEGAAEAQLLREIAKAETERLPARKVTRRLESLSNQVRRLEASLQDFRASTQLWASLTSALLSPRLSNGGPADSDPDSRVRGLESQLAALRQALEDQKLGPSQAALLQRLRRDCLGEMATLSGNRWDLLAELVCVASEGTYEPDSDSLRHEHHSNLQRVR